MEEKGTSGFAWHKVIRVLLYVLPWAAVFYVYVRVLEFGVTQSAQRVHLILMVVDLLLLIVSISIREMIPPSYVRSHMSWIYAALAGAILLHVFGAVVNDVDLQRVLLFAPASIAALVLLVRIFRGTIEANKEDQRRR